MALSGNHRLKKASQISFVCKKGASWKTPFFRCVFFPSPWKTFSVVVIVSKKYDKRATERNLIRRRITGVFQQEKNFPPLQLVVFPYESAKNVDSQDLKKEILKMLSKIEKWDFSRAMKKKSIQKKNR